MDPFSITCGVLAFAGAINSARKCVTKLQAMRDAPLECRTLAEEIVDLQALLTAVQAALPTTNETTDSPQGLGIEVEEQVVSKDLVYRQVERVESRLNQLVILIPDEGIRESRLPLKAENWRWLKSRAKAKKIQTDLQQYKLDLLVGLGALTHRTVDRLQTSQPAPAVAVQPVATTSSGPQEIVEEISDSETPDDPATPPPQYNEDQSESNLSQSSPQSLITKTSQRSGNDIIDFEFIMTRRLQNASAEHEANSTNPPLLQRSTNHCAAWCSCRCHAQTQYKTPLATNNSIGSLQLAVQGLSLKQVECNQRLCKRRPHPSIRAVYRPPQWLSSQFISVAVQCRPSYGPEINVKLPRVRSWNCPLWEIGITGDEEQLRRLLESGQASPWDVNPLGGSVLHYAAERRHLSLCALLLRLGATASLNDDLGGNPTVMAWEHFLSSSLTCDEYLQIESLFADDSYIDTRAFSVPHKIVLGLAPGLDLAAHLRASTADIDARDATNRTPLSWAAARSDLRACKTLLDFAADPSLANDEGKTPLHYARHPAIVGLLLNHGAQLDARDFLNRTPLHWVVRTGASVATALALLDAGAEINARARGEETALHNALIGGHGALALALLERGADAGIRNDGGDSALMFCLRKRDLDPVLEVLLRRDEVREEVCGTMANGRAATVAHEVARWCGRDAMRMVRRASGGGMNSAVLEMRDESGMTPGECLEERLKTLPGVEARALRDAFESLFVPEGVVEVLVDEEIDASDGGVAVVQETDKLEVDIEVEEFFEVEEYFWDAADTPAAPIVVEVL